MKRGAIRLSLDKSEARELLDGTKEKNIFPHEGGWFCPKDKSLILTQKQTE